jgi:hypothetical protein
VLDTLGSALPELCLTLPSGEVVDFLMYGRGAAGRPPPPPCSDNNIPLPREVPHDEWAGIYATVRIHFVDERQAKRQQLL